jgi:hypothetical protein
MSLQAVYDAIVARVAAETGKPVGDARAPTEDPAAGPHPYAVVYPLDDGDIWDDPAQSGLNVVGGFQVTSVARHRGGAQWMQSAARAALVGWAPPVAGAGVVVHDGSGPILPDDTFSPPLFTVTDRFALWLAG